VLVGLVSSQYGDETLDVVLDRVIAVDQLIQTVNKQALLVRQLPLSEEMEEDSASTDKWLDIAAKASREERRQLG
jgi:hypothetical protein